VRSGLAAEIEGLRASVQRQTSEQRLTVAEANFADDKLNSGADSSDCRVDKSSRPPRMLPTRRGPVEI